MQICTGTKYSGSHEEICYESDPFRCPMCDLISDHKDEVRELMKEIEELKKEIEELNAKIKEE